MKTSGLTSCPQLQGHRGQVLGCLLHDDPPDGSATSVDEVVKSLLEQHLGHVDASGHHCIALLCVCVCVCACVCVCVHVFVHVCACVCV